VTRPDERNRNKRVRCIWDLKQPPTNRTLKNNGATQVSYMLCLTDDFCPTKILSLRFLRIFADESFLPSFCFSLQLGMSQYNRLSVQLCPKIQSGDSITRND